ncbi:MAG: DUF1343 domain-containing protein [Chlamydiales bacterium]|nr:DUF1343 domain-containing protein [Chlamydiales bacterium]
MLLKLAAMVFPFLLFGSVTLGIDCFFRDGHAHLLKGKKIALVTNHTAIDSQMQLTAQRFLNAPFTLAAIWTPEHGLYGSAYAGENVPDSHFHNKIPVYSLHGDCRRPKKELFSGIDVIIYDIQDIGVRSYTFATTLYYVMEAASQNKVPIIVLDRPNPLGGVMVDGPMMCPKMRSFVGYLNVPYCHGMTIGELARLFNHEYAIKCELKVVAMEGWKRHMRFKDTHLSWIPTSPNIPESDTPLYCATTGILGELGMVNIGIGFTMPFKIVGAPWMDAQQFASSLNNQKMEGVRFSPFHFRPFYGLYKGESCQGVLIDIVDVDKFQPLKTQYMLIGMIKTLYPKIFEKKLAELPATRKEMFCKVNGNTEILNFLEKERYPAWQCITFDHQRRQTFLDTRKKYLCSTY